MMNSSPPPTLSVILPSGNFGKGIPVSSRPQSSGGEARSLTRTQYRQTEVISESGWLEDIDTSLYAAPENIDTAASVMDMPELPLPLGREISAGQLRVKIFVNENGYVDQIELLESSLQEDYSTKLVETFKASRFVPGMLQGNPVKSWRIVEIDYVDP